MEPETNATNQYSNKVNTTGSPVTIWQ